MREASGGAATRICWVADFTMPVSRLVTASSSLGYPSWASCPARRRASAARAGRISVMSQDLQYRFQCGGNFLFRSARLCNGEIEVGIGIGLVLEGVVPPFAVVGIEAAVLHDG